MRVLKELCRQPSAVFGLVIVLAVVFAAIAAPWLAPYAPDNQMFDGLTLETRYGGAEGTGLREFEFNVFAVSILEGGLPTVGNFAFDTHGFLSLSSNHDAIRHTVFCQSHFSLFLHNFAG